MLSSMGLFLPSGACSPDQIEDLARLLRGQTSLFPRIIQPTHDALEDV